MIERQGVNLPPASARISPKSSTKASIAAASSTKKPLTNALGPDFKQILTRENLIERYKSI